MQSTKTKIKSHPVPTHLSNVMGLVVGCRLYDYEAVAAITLNFVVNLL